MPSRVEVGHGHALGGDARAAGVEAARAAVAALERPLSLVVVFASAYGDPAAALAGVREITGPAPLVGLSTEREIDGAEVAGAVAVVALATAEVTVRIGAARRGGREVQAALDEALAASGGAPYLAGPGPWLEATRAGRAVLGLLLVSGEAAAGAGALAEQLTRRSGGRLPVLALGAAAAPGGPGVVMAGEGALEDGVALALVETTLEMGIAAGPDGQALRDAVLRGRVTDPVVAFAAVRGPPPRPTARRDEVAVMAAALGGVPLVGFRDAAGPPGVTALVLGRELSREAQVEALRRTASDELERLVEQRTRELAESEERYRMLVRGTPDSAVFLVGADLRCTLAEGTLLERIGGPGSLVGRRLDDHPEQTGALEAVVRRALAGETVAVERQVGALALLLRAAPFRSGEGGPPAAMLVATDVSDRRRLEERVRQAQKMEAVGRLAGGIAHDFNNILTVILGSARDLRRSAADDDGRELAQEVIDAGDRATALIRQLLAFSRQQALRPRELDLNEVVRDLEKMVRRLIGEDIAVTSALAPGRAAVRADPGQLEQVILNLVVNARDAMPRGGRLTLATALVDGAPGDAQRAPSPGPHVLLSVRDTGTGMAPEVQQHLFEPFFTTKERGKGTGLGLATVYGVVQQSGGAVSVRSAPGAGTTIEIYLPHLLEEEGGDAEEAPAVERPPRGHETVLLVEDDAAVRALMRRILEGAGYRVAEARQPEEAIQSAAEVVPDLLLTDVVMPGMGGPELAAELLACRPALRVLYVSGYTEDESLRSGALPVGQAFLQKPFSGDELARAVRETLDAPLAAGPQRC